MTDYLVEENRVLREQIGNRRLRFTDDQRRRLAARAKKLGWNNVTAAKKGTVQTRRRLGGMLNYYYREAA